MPVATQDHYPTYVDVAAFLTSFNVLKNAAMTPQQQTIITQYINTRIQQWERLTGYTPFLCAQDGAGVPMETTRLFNPPGNENSPTRLGGYYWFSSGGIGRSNRLYIECGFTFISQILVDVTYQYAGNPLVAGQDYLLQPNNALVEGKPYNEVQFLWNMFGGLDQSISITGNFGYGTVLPADVWQAIVVGAAADLLPQIALFQLGDQIEIEEKDEKVVLRQGKGQNAYSVLSDQWKRQYMTIMKSGGYVREALR